MKILFTVCLSILPLCISHAQQAGATDNMPAILASELEEYTAKRTEGVKKLTELAKVELLAIQQQQMSAANLEATNAITKAIELLPITSIETVKPPEEVPAAAVKVLKDHASKVSAGVAGLNALFIPRIEKLKAEMLRSGNIDGANAAAKKIQELKNEAEELVPPKFTPGTRAESVDSFTVEALIDGYCELHITKEGLYWLVPGNEAKPGLHAGANEATYINGSRWKPKWQVKGERGPDRSDVYSIKNSSPKLAVETERISSERFGKNENRTPVATSVKDDHFVVTIRDPESGSRWYKLRIKSVP